MAAVTGHESGVSQSVIGSALLERAYIRDAAGPLLACVLLIRACVLDVDNSSRQCKSGGHMCQDHVLSLSPLSVKYPGQQADILQCD